MPVITASSLFFGIGARVGSSPRVEDPPNIESRIRALEVKEEERYQFIHQQLVEIKARLNALGER